MLILEIEVVDNSAKKDRGHLFLFCTSKSSTVNGNHVVTVCSAIFRTMTVFIVYHKIKFESFILVLW